jgi:hypothetical protein
VPPPSFPLSSLHTNAACRSSVPAIVLTRAQRGFSCLRSCNKFVTWALTPIGSSLGAIAMVNPEHLRSLAERMLAMAMKASDPRLAEWFSVKAGEYLDKAQTLEAAAPPVECPQHVTRQAEHPQSEDPEKNE